MANFLTLDEIATVASNAGFAGDDLTTAVAVAIAESGGDASNFGDPTIGQGSYGLWQISSRWHPEYGPDFTKLYDPQTNANAAYAIYSAAGNSFSPWTTFNTGTYEGFMQSAGAAVATFLTQNPGTSIGILVAGIVLLFMLRRA